MASKIVRSGNSPLRNLIRHLRLSPSITSTPAAAAAAAVGYNRSYLFPRTVVPRVESNQAVVKSAKGDQFAVWAFAGLGHQSGVNVHCSPTSQSDDDNGYISVSEDSDDNPFTDDIPDNYCDSGRDSDDSSDGDVE